MVPNPNEMISTTTPMTMASTQVLEPRGAIERLNLQRGEVQHQVRFPQSFVLTDTIPNPMGASSSGGMLRKVFSSIPRSKKPINLMGVGKVMCQAPLFFIETLAISSVQPIVVFGGHIMWEWWNTKCDG